MSATTAHISDRNPGLTHVDLAELIALRARAGKPIARAARVRTPLAGGHVSALRGRGMDYAESRAYQSGDDSRNIDWRRTARSGKWHTKLFQAEREHSMLLLVDTHPTMQFGTRTRFKSVAAARAAAWLAWTCVRGGDRIGALAFGNQRAAIDPQAGTRGALAVLGALARWDAEAHAVQSGNAEPLSAALTRARRMALSGNEIWMLSDGWCTDASAAHALIRLKHHADVRAVIVVDALEHALAPAGDYVFETDAGRRHVELSTATSRAGLRDRLAHGSRTLAKACDEASVPWVMLATSEEPELGLAPLLRRRAMEHRR
ncbi:MAG: hypothetical protein OJF61_000017 [Rhodanobacteraceae bacterium]|nr:MAG: hypothetical protein OJF61_000017 [Rhodanobacteraceae bacterium]